MTFLIVNCCGLFSLSLSRFSLSLITSCSHFLSPYRFSTRQEMNRRTISIAKQKRKRIQHNTDSATWPHSSIWIITAYEPLLLFAKSAYSISFYGQNFAKFTFELLLLGCLWRCDSIVACSIYAQGDLAKWCRVVQPCEP